MRHAGKVEAYQVRLSLDGWVGLCVCMCVCVCVCACVLVLALIAAHCRLCQWGGSSWTLTGEVTDAVDNKDDQVFFIELDNKVLACDYVCVFLYPMCVHASALGKPKRMISLLVGCLPHWLVALVACLRRPRLRRRATLPLFALLRAD